MSALPIYSNDNESMSPRVRRMLDHPDLPPKDKLQQWVDGGLTDKEIGFALRRDTGRGRSERWVRNARMAHGIRRPLFCGARQLQAAGAIIDPMFPSDADRDAAFEKIRHGEWSVVDIESLTGCSSYECRLEYELWLRRNRNKPLEAPALRKARTILSDDDATPIEKAKVILGRRFEMSDRGGFKLDGKLTSLSIVIEEAEEEAKSLGLPRIRNKV